MGGSEGEAGKRPLYLIALFAVLATFALAGPAWKQLETPVFRNQSALVILLDLSRSMDATDIKPTRLSRARHKLIDILKNRLEGQTALVIYAGGAFVVSPLTQDAKTIISQVSALKTTLIPRQGSRPDLALLKAGQLLKQAGVPLGEVLLITDGLENVPREELTQALSTLLASGHTLSILGVGTLEGAPIKLAKGGFFRDKSDKLIIPKLDEIGLVAMAQEGEGRYQRISNDAQDIDSLFATSAMNSLDNTTEETGLKTDRWREEGPWLLLLLLPLAALAFRRGILLVIVSLLLSLPPDATALDWESLWSRPDQQAQAIFEAGDESAAAELFDDPEWKATAHYRAGDYQESIDSLAGIQNPEALYNKGNALAQLGKLPEALAAYDEALKLNPEHQDAIYNKEQIEAQMSQQEPNQNNQQEGEPSENPQDSDKDGEQDSESDQDEEGEDSEASDQSQSQNQQNDPQEGQQEDQAGENQPSDSEQDSQQESESGEKKEDESDQEKSENQAQDTEKQDDAESKKNEEAKLQKESSPNDDTQSDEQKESALALEQWLRRIPDDPGGLLRRKFLYQSQQQRPTDGEEAGW